MTKKLAVAGAALLAMGLLAGCTSQSGAAVIVNGTTISEQEVNDLASEIAGAGGSRLNALNIGVTVAGAKPILAGYSDVVTDDYKSAAIANCSTTVGVEANEDSSSLLKDYCVIMQLATDNSDFYDEANQALTSPDIELNPRYGDLTSDTALPAFLSTDDRSAPTSDATN